MTTKRLNIKFLAILGVGTVVFLVAAYGLHEIQVRRNAAGLLRRAETAREEGDLKESARLRMRYLSHVPDDAEQYKQTALDLKESLFDKVLNREEVERPDVDLAVKFMSDAVTFNGEDEEIRREASEFWFQFGKYNVAVENLERISDSWTDEDRMRYINSLRLLGGPSEERAMAEFEKTIGWDRVAREFQGTGSHPKLLDAYQSLVILLIQRELDREAAVKVLNQMVAVNAEDPKAYLNRARLIRVVRGTDGIDQSYEDVQTAYEKAPEDLDVIQAMSEMMLETDRAEDAKRLVKLGLDQAESIQEKARLYQLLAEIHIRSQDIDGALAVLDRGNREVPRDRELLWSKARLLLDQKRHAEVEAMYKPLTEAGHPDPMIGYLKARILMDNEKYREAVRALRTIRDILPGMTQYEADIYLSEAYGRLGKFDQQLLIFRSLHERNPDNERVNESYVKILLQLNRSRDAQEFLSKRIAELKNAGQPIPKSYETMLASLQMRDAQLGSSSLTDEERSALVDKFRESWQDDESLTDAQRLLFKLQELRQTEDPAVVKNKLKQMINATPDSFEMWQMLINLADDEQEAAKFFEMMKSKVDVEQYGASMALLRIQIAIKHAPDSFPTVVQQVEDSLGQFEEHQQLSLLHQMGKLGFAMSQRELAVRLLEKTLAAPSASPAVKTEILNMLFEDALAQSNVDEINSVIQRIRDLVGEDDETYRIVEARRIVWNIRNQHINEADRPQALRQARDLVQSIRSARREWLPAILVEADLHLLDNDPSSAIELLEVAHNLQRNNPRIIRSIATAYRFMKQPRKADEWMRRLPSTLRNDQDNRLELLNLWARRSIWSSEDEAKAVKLLEEVAPADTVEWNNQALRSRFYLHLKQFDKAEEAAKRAAELAPEIPDVWTNWMNVYVIQKDNEKATQVIQQAAQKLPEDQKLVTLGRCFALAGDLQKAQQYFVAALKDDKDNAQIKRLLAETLIRSRDPRALQAAIQVMQSIIVIANQKTADGASPTSEELTATTWARRTLATILSNTNSYTNFLQALALLEENAIDGELLPNDLTLFVAFCNKRPERSSWDRAILRLDQIAQNRPLNDLEVFMKAQIYEKYGDEYWDDVKKMATGVLAKHSSNKALVESYVRWLLKRGEVKEAEAWSERNLDPTTVTRFRVDVHGDAKQGNIQRAVQKIKQRAPKTIETEEEKGEQLMVAAIAEELGQYDERFFKMAEGLLRQLVEKSPGDLLRLATLIGSRGDGSQVKEALQMCVDAHKYEVPYTVSAGVAVNVIRQHSKDWDGPLAPVIQQLSQWMEQISTNNPDDLGLQWRVAEYFEMIGNLDRAEAKYRAMLDSPNFKNRTDRGMVLNNLAYAMALNGKSGESMEFILEAEKLLPPSADLIDTKGYIYLVGGEIDKAISSFQEAINTGPKSGHKYFHLALAFHQNNNREKAEASWKEALANGLDRFRLPPALRRQYDKLAAEFGGVAKARLTETR